MKASTRFSVLSALLLAACADGTGPAAPSAMQAQGTVATAAAVGSSLSPAVVVKDARGRGVPGVAVTFEVTAGGGQVTAASAQTNGLGIASPGSWTLGTALATNTLVARAGSLPPVTFNVTTNADAPSVVTPLPSNVAAGVPGMTLTPGPGVRVTDRYENPVAGTDVQFFVTTAGHGTIAGPVQKTDAAGVARPVWWKLGTSTGVQMLNARAGGITTSISVAVSLPGATISSFAGHSITCPVGRPCPFTASVMSGSQPSPGQPVQWRDMTNAVLGTSTTNARGFTSFSLPPTTSTGTGTVRAVLESSGHEVSFDYTVVQGGGFNIDVRILGTPTASQQNIIRQAARRWEDVITGDLPDITLPPGLVTAGECSSDVNHPALQGPLDDLVIFVEVVPIDTVGKVLGLAGPCRSRTGGLPIYGVILLDQWDVADMETRGTLRDVVQHEMGHVLGLTSGFFVSKGLAPSNLSSHPAPLFSGVRAGHGFVLGGGAPGSGVPLENCINAQGQEINGCGSGTRGSHWREAVFTNELMTGYISPSTNPLSTVTIGALMDLGYQVDFSRAESHCVAGWSGYPNCQLLQGVSFMQMVAPERHVLHELPAPRMLPSF